MADFEQIGGVEIGVIADLSSLTQDFSEAEQIAKAAGEKVADSFTAGAADAGAAFDPLKDGLAGLGEAAKQAGDQLGDAFDKAGAGAREYSTDAQALIDKQKDLESELVSVQGTLAEIQNAYEAGAVGADVLARAQNDVTDAMERAHPAFKETVEEEHEVERGFAAMAEQLLAFGEALAVTEGLKEFGEEALIAYGAIQKTEIALKALTGETAEGVHETVEGLKAMAVELGLDSHALEQAQVRLTAFGVEGEKIPLVLRAAADAAAATDRGFDAVANSIERMALAGTASGKQLVALGLSVHDLAHALGVADDELKDAFKDLSVNERIETIIKALQKYQGVAEEVGRGIAAQWQDVKTRLDDVFEALGEALAPIVGHLLELLSKDVLPAIQHLIESFETLPEPVKEAAVAFGLAVAAIAPLTVAVAGFGLAITGIEATLPAVTGFFEAMGLSMGSLLTAFETIAPVITAVGIALAGLYFTGAAEEAKNFAETLYSSIPGLADLFQPIIDIVKDIGKGLADLALPFDIFKEALGSIGGLLPNIKQIVDAAFAPFAALRDVLKDASAALEFLSGNYKSMAEAAQANLAKLHQANRDAFDPAQFDGYTRGLRDAGAANEAYTKTKKEAAEAAKAHAAAEKAFLDEIGKAHAFIGPLTEDAQRLNDYFGEAAKSIAHVSDAIDELADANTLTQYLEQGDQTIVDISGDSAQMAQYMKDAAASIDGVKQAADALAADQSLQDWYEQNNATVREGIELTNEWRVPIIKAADAWEQTGKRIETVTQKLHDAVERDLVRGLSEATLRTHDFGKTFEKVGEDIISIVLDKILKRAIQPLLDGLDKVLAKIPGLGAIGGSGGGGTSIPGASPSGGSSGSGGGGFLGGSLLGAIGVGVDIAAGITQGIQMARLINLTGEIEVTTRKIQNEVTNLRADEWEREGHLFAKLDDMWNEIRNVVDILRLMAAFGAGPSGGEGGGPNPALIEAIIKTINSRPASVEGSTQSLTDLIYPGRAAAGTQVFEGLDPLLNSSDEVSGSLSNLASAVGDTASQLYGQLPPAFDQASTAAQSLAESFSKATAEFATVAGPVLGSQFAALAASAPSVSVSAPGAFMPGTPSGYARLGGDTPGGIPIYVNAMTPDARGIVDATIAGLEKKGIRIR